MTQFLLAAAGTAIAGPVGGAVGSIFGAYVDQRYVYPELFPADEFEGSRVDDFAFSSGREGAGIFETYGPETRVQGQVIWRSKVKEVKTEVEVGGLGGFGSSQTQVVYEYFVDLAIAFSKSTLKAGIVDVRKVWAEGNLFYEGSPNFAYTGSAVSVATSTGPKARMELVNADGSVDLTDLKSGKKVTTSGFSNGANNVTVKVARSWRVSDTETRARLKYTSQVNESAGALVTITQTKPQFKASEVAGVSFAKGTTTQLPEALVEAKEGAGNVPAYRGMVVAYLNDVALAPFGNRIPVGWEALIEQEATLTDAALIERVCKLKGKRTSAQIDVTGIGSNNVRGYKTRGPVGAITALQPVMTAFDILSQEVNGVLRFFYRKDAELVDIDAEDLAAAQAGDSSPATPFDVQDNEPRDLPREVTVQYSDPDQDYQTGGDSAVRINATSGRVIRIDLSMMTLGGAAEARAIARRALWMAWMQKLAPTIQLPPKYRHVLENDRLRFVGMGKTWTALALQVDRGANGLLVIQTAEERDELYDFTEASEPPSGTPADGIYIPPELDLAYMDVPALTAARLSLPSFYWACAAEDPDVQFVGATLREKLEGFFPPSTTIRNIATTSAEATLGNATNALSGSAGPYQWDRASTLNISLIQGTLESVSKLDVMNGANRLLVASGSTWELIGFQNATLESDGTYTVDTLLRGLRDTVDAMTGHAIGDQVVLVATGVMAEDFIANGLGGLLVNTEHQFQVIPDGGTDADFDTYGTFQFAGENMRPFAPAYVRATRNGSNDATVTWRRKTRAFQRVLNCSDPPVEENAIPGTSPVTDEQYRVNLYDPSFLTIQVTKVVNAETATFTNAEITGAGYTSGDPINVKVSQFSTVYGYGRERSVTV